MGRSRHHPAAFSPPLLCPDPRPRPALYRLPPLTISTAVAQEGVCAYVCRRWRDRSSDGATEDRMSTDVRMFPARPDSATTGVSRALPVGTDVQFDVARAPLALCAEQKGLRTEYSERNNISSLAKQQSSCSDTWLASIIYLYEYRKKSPYDFVSKILLLIKRAFFLYSTTETVVWNKIPV